MQKDCNICGAGFEITEAESALYQKIINSFEVEPMPPRSSCIDCNWKDKMHWRNERTLHRRTCDKTGTDILSHYTADVQFPVFKTEEWWSDSWNAADYAMDYDPEVPIFDQLNTLHNKVPKAARVSQHVTNCDYTNYSFEANDSYLSFCCYSSDTVFYSYWTMRCKDVMDCMYCVGCEQCYNCVDCSESYHCVSSQITHGSSDCYHCFDCRSCRDCFGCVGLRQKQYYWYNQQLSKEQYEQKLQEFLQNQSAHTQKIATNVQALKAKHPHLYSLQENSEECTGDFIINSKNCVNCFGITKSEDCMNVTDAETKDAINEYHTGWSELTYNTMSSVRSKSVGCSIGVWDSENVFYSIDCKKCTHCFACTGLQNAEYCILNKQYSKEDYYKTVAHIIAQMKQANQWGEFFPATMCPYPYNETSAQEFYPLTKEAVLQKGLKWRDKKDNITGVTKTIPAAQLPDNIADIPDDILNWAITCEASGRPFKVVKQELEFYRRHNIPVPKQHPEERYDTRFHKRMPRKLHSRQCSKCAKDIESTYGPDRPEIIYCEACYLAEVY